MTPFLWLFVTSSFWFLKFLCLAGWFGWPSASSANTAG